MEQDNNVVLPMRFNRLTTILLSAAFTTMLIFIALHVVSTQNGQAYSIPSSYNVSAQKQYDSSKVCNQIVSIMGLTSSSSERGNPPENTIDMNLNTRWSSHAVGKYIQADLGSVKTICEASIAWFRGDTRQYLFPIRNTNGMVRIQSMA